MIRHSPWRGVVAAVLVLAMAAAIAIGAYNAGVAHGFAEAGRAIAAAPAQAGSATAVYMWPRPWGFGFFPIFPLFFGLFFFMFVVRGLMGGGPRGRGGWACRHDGVPPAFEEWHRRAHADHRSPTPNTGSTT